MRGRMFALALCVAGCVAVLSAATIQDIKLADGSDDKNRIVAAVYDNPGFTLDVTVTGAVKPKTKFVRRLGGRLPATRGPEYDLDPKVNVGALLTDAMRSEATAMGLTRQGTTNQRWRVNGTIKDVYLESRQIYWGATLFYGYMDLEFAVTGPGAESRTVAMRVHNYSGGYNAGFGRRDEAESGAAHLFVEGAQEVLARLNREFFTAPPSQLMSSKLALVQSGVTKDQLGDLRMLALSGLPAAPPALLASLLKQEDENLRAALVDALAIIGSAEVVAPLSARYSAEDEDVRWYSLKAMDYIGGADAFRVVTTFGMKDAAAKRLAGRITGEQ